MITDARKAVEQATEQNLLVPFIPDEETKKKFLKSQKKGALQILLGSVCLLLLAVFVVVLLVSITHVIVFSLRIAAILLIILLLPIYGVYNIFSVGSSIRKGDYAFYLGEVTVFNGDSYIIRGLEDGQLHFAVKPQDASLTAGNRVIVARLKDELSLLEYTCKSGNT